MGRLKAGRRRYVRYYATIGDYDRDVGQLAKLLVSKDPRLVIAAQTKLISLTDLKTARLRNDSSKAAREGARLDWQRWWKCFG